MQRLSIRVTPIPSKVPSMSSSTYCKYGMQEGLHVALFLQIEGR